MKRYKKYITPYLGAFLMGPLMMLTEAAIRESFKNELKDTTRIIIAQRISSVQDADRILVLDDGKIIGSGTHEELLRTCRAYEEIYATQIGENRAEEAEA